MVRNILIFISILFSYTVVIAQAETLSNDTILRELMKRGVVLNNDEVQSYLKQMNNNPIKTNNYKVQVLTKHQKIALDYMARTALFKDQNDITTSNILTASFLGVSLVELITDLIPYILEITIHDTPQDLRVFKWAKYGKRMYIENLDLRQYYKQ